jgi:hypothetical protein
MDELDSILAWVRKNFPKSTPKQQMVFIQSIATIKVSCPDYPLAQEE